MARDLRSHDRGLRSRRCSPPSGFRPGMEPENRPKRKDVDGRQPDHHDDPGLRAGPQDRLGVGGAGMGRRCGRGLVPLLPPSSRCSSPPPTSTCSPASTPGSIPASWPPWRWPSPASAGGASAIFRWPTREAAIRRLERDSGVPHRPLVAVQDNLAAGKTDPMAAGPVGGPSPPRGRAPGWPEQQAGPPRPGRPRQLGAALRAAAGPDRGHRRRRRLAQRPHGRRRHAGLPAAAAGRRQPVDRAAGLYRQAAGLSGHGRARQGAARAGRQQDRGLRRRHARPQAAAALDRRQ